MPNQKSEIDIKELRDFRIICVFAAIMMTVVGLFGKISNPSAIEPMFERLSISLMFVVILAATYIFSDFRKHITGVMYFSFYVVMTWVIRLISLNNFSASYATVFLLGLFGVNVFFKRISDFIIFNTYIITSVAVVLYGTSAPEIGREIFLVYLISVSFIYYIILRSRLKIQKELKEEKNNIESIISSMGEGLFVVDKDYRVVNMNPAAEKLLRMSASQLMGQDLRKMVVIYKDGVALPAEDRPVGITLKTGKTVIGGLDDKYSLTTSNLTHPIPISLSTAALRGEDITGAVVVFKDITQERQSKEIIEKAVIEKTREFQEEKVRLAASVNSLSLGFIMTDTKEKVIVMNPVAQNILRLTTPIPSLTEVESILDGAIDLRKWNKECLRERKFFNFKEIYFNSRFYHIILGPISVGNEAIGTVILIEDITQAKLLERSKDEFFAIASHELRTPLTAIRGNTSLIQEYFSDKLKDPDLKEMISDMHASSIRLIEIVNDFLDVSRLEQGKVDFKKEKFDLSALINENLEELEVKAREKGLYLKFDGPKISEISSDKDRVKEVIINLVGNGINFTEKGGVTISLKKDIGYMKVIVSDTGTGISKVNQNLLFKKFQQAGERVLVRDVTKGTGMGLYISKLLVEGMGGKIWVEKSEVGKGSTFAFSLPLG